VQFGSDTYRKGALERLEDARLLLVEHKRFAASIYFGGLAVEGILRSLLCLRDKAFDERHDLYAIAKRIEYLGLLRKGDRDADFRGRVQDVVRGWSNSLRFASTIDASRWLRVSKRVRNDDAGALNKYCNDYWEACEGVVNRCNLLWQHNR